MVTSGQSQDSQQSYASDKQRKRQSVELAINLSGSFHSSSSSKGAEGPDHNDVLLDLEEFSQDFV